MQRCLGCMREFGEEFDVCPHCGYIVGTAAASKNHLAPGTVLQERYILGKALGQGGFGITYIAWDNRIGRAVAIKEYMPNALASRMTGEKEISCYNEEARRQFDLGLAKTRKEAHALSQFGALESVVKVHDCIEENGTAYIVMELLRGRTVKEILAERGRLSFAETMRVMTPVLQTLDAMHKVGMIHRDVSPDNIFVCEDGKIKLLDFGAARVVSGTDEKTLSVMLKAGYAPVEQYSTKAKQGPYTDVYAASATIYKMLTGETPPDSLGREKDGGDLKALTQTDVPQSAQETIRHGMALNAPDRIGSAQELLDELQKDLPEDVKGIDPREFLIQWQQKNIKRIAWKILAIFLVLLIVTGTIAYTLQHNKESSMYGVSEIRDSSEEGSFVIENSSERITEESRTELSFDKSDDTSFSKQWIGQYKTFLQKYYEKTDYIYSVQDIVPADSFTFTFCFIDSDSIPEIVVSEGIGVRSNRATLISYSNGSVYSSEGLGSYGEIYYQKEKGIVISQNGAKMSQEVFVYELKDGVLQQIWKGEEAPEGYDLQNLAEGKMHYYSNESEVSENEYNKVFVSYYTNETVSSALGWYNDDMLFGANIPFTKQNIDLFFSALENPDSVQIIRTGQSLSLTGTIKEQVYLDDDTAILELDNPIIAQLPDYKNNDSMDIYYIDSVQIIGKSHKQDMHVSISGRVITASSEHHHRYLLLEENAIID